MTLSSVIDFGIATTVGFTLRIVSPETAQSDYHSALDGLMRTLLTCFGSAHAEGGADKPITHIYSQTMGNPTDEQIEQLEDAVDVINTTYPSLYVTML